MVARIPTTVHNGITFVTPYPTANYTYDTVNDNITGFGTYVLNANGQSSLGFLHGVAAGQTIIMNGNYTANHAQGTPDGPVKEEVLISDPANFHSHIYMNYVEPTIYPYRKAPPNWEQLDVGMQMVGRAADSYSYHNDMLSLWSHNRVVQQLNLTVRDPYGITVQAAPGGWIFVSANDRGNHGIGFLNTPPSYWPGMPVHV